MLTTGPSQPSRVQPKAASPKAPMHGASYLSFSTAETLTPESSAGGRPSRASALETVSPQSRPSFADPIDRLHGSAGGKVSVQNSSTATLRSLRLSTGEFRRRKYTSGGSSSYGYPGRLSGYGGSSSRQGYTPGYTPGAGASVRPPTAEASVAPGTPASVQPMSRMSPRGVSSGTPASVQRMSSNGASSVQRMSSNGTREARCGNGTPASVQQARLCGSGAVGMELELRTASSSRAANCAGASEGGQTPRQEDEAEVLIEGPLQQRSMLFFWRWRWCVLDRRELRVYQNEQVSLLQPEKPLERHSARALNVAPDLHWPSVLVLSGAAGGDDDPLLFLRTGPGVQWEEVAATMLWLRAFASASRSCAAAHAGPR
jgi:hypothetical protein